VGVLEGDDGLRARDHHALDRRIEVLEEAADREDVAAAAEPLEAGVDVLDEGAGEVGIAADRPAAHHVGELEGRELAELGAVDGAAVAHAQIRVGLEV
jgi:hypothetical protein